MAEELAAQQRDADALAHQAHQDKKPGGKLLKGTESKLASHRDLIVIAISVLGVIIAFASFKHQKAAAAPAAADPSGVDPSTAAGIMDDPNLAVTSGAGIGVGSGSVAGSDGSSSNSDLSAQQGFQEYLSNLSDEISTSIAGLKTTSATATAWTRPTSFSAPGWSNEPDSEPPHVLYGVAAKGLTYIKDLRTGFIYQVNPNGKRARVYAIEYAALGSPKYTTIGAPPKKAAPKPPPAKKK